METNTKPQKRTQKTKQGQPHDCKGRTGPRPFRRNKAEIHVSGQFLEERKLTKALTDIRRKDNTTTNKRKTTTKLCKYIIPNRRLNQVARQGSNMIRTDCLMIEVDNHRWYYRAAALTTGNNFLVIKVLKAINKGMDNVTGPMIEWINVLEIQKIQQQNF